MTRGDYARKLDELDRLMNDPHVPMRPETIWCLADELSRAELFESDEPTGIVGDPRCDV